MNTNCNRCFKEVKTINVMPFGDTLLLVIPEGNYFDNEKVKICICQNIPDGCTSDMIVKIQIGNSGTIYPFHVCGHNVYSDQIHTRRCYITEVATDNALFCYCGGSPLHCTSHVNPPVLTAPVAAPEVVPEVALTSLSSKK